jgi:undecaprenyl-phosphate 4-deoxy-4-formamido-L-arabinose transferase
LNWGAARYDHVPVHFQPRRFGRTQYNFPRMVGLVLDIISGYSTAPLRAASILGFLFSLFGMISMVFVLARFLFQGCPVPGFPFLAMSIAIFSGIQLLALGILGEYLARVHMRQMQKPCYTILGTTDGPESRKDLQDKGFAG